MQLREFSLAPCPSVACCSCAVSLQGHAENLKAAGIQLTFCLPGLPLQVVRKKGDDPASDAVEKALMKTTTRCGCAPAVPKRCYEY